MRDLRAFATRSSVTPMTSKRLDEVLARLVAVGVGRDAHGVDEAHEGVLDVTTEQVEVGDEDLRVDVRRRGGCRGPGSLEVGTLGALHEPHLGETDLGVGVGRALREGLAVGRGGCLEVARLDGIEGLLVQRRQGLLLLGLVGRCGSVLSDRDGTGDTVLRREPAAPGR